MGLSQVYGFVKQSGGNVKIYSERSHGTTIKLYLPRPQADGMETGQNSDIPLPEGRDEESILVVEDDEQMRAESVEALRDLSYRVFEAAAGTSAVRILERAGRLDLLFADVVLPGGMTGPKSPPARESCALASR